MAREQPHGVAFEISSRGLGYFRIIPPYGIISEVIEYSLYIPSVISDYEPMQGKTDRSSLY